MNRRRFLKYASAAGLGVAGVALIGYELQRPLETPPTGTTSTQPITSLQSATPPRLDARFSFKTAQRTLEYIVPHSAEEIQFINETDVSPASSPVSYEWSIDGTMVANSRDYASALPETRTTGIPHTVTLTARSATSTNSNRQQIDVDTQSLSQYTQRKFKMPIKGIVYNTGYALDESDMQESVDVIAEELGCNAVRIKGYKDEMIEKCVNLAIDKRIKTILVGPDYGSWRNISIDEHTRRIIEFSSIAERLRQESNSVTLVVGNELTIETSGIYEGQTYLERIEETPQRMHDRRYHEKLNSHLGAILQGVRAHFDGEVTYAAGDWEDVDWHEFDVVGSNEYYASEWFTEAEWVQKLARLKKWGKPVFITETGSCSFAGCGRWGAGAWHRWVDQKYSEEEQAKNIQKSLELCADASVTGVFLFSFIHDDELMRKETSFGILSHNPSGTHRRKLGFYAYREYLL